MGGVSRRRLLNDDTGTGVPVGCYDVDSSPQACGVCTYSTSFYYWIIIIGPVVYSPSKIRTFPPQQNCLVPKESNHSHRVVSNHIRCETTSYVVAYSYFSSFF
jgi:hypothetical protein